EKIHLLYGGLNSLPEGLRWLQWDEYPSKSLPSKFRPQHLVRLILSHSPIRRCWKGYDQAPTLNLMVLNLSYCKNLIEIPNISSSSYLEELLLYGCESLAEVFSHVQYLTKLITLDLRKCVKLKRLPPRLDSKLLKYVLMSHCLKVTHCPEVNSGELKELDLYETSLVELPSAIYNVKQDGTLHIYGLNITKFPAITSSLKTFELSHTSIREMDLHNYHHQKAHSELLFTSIDLNCCKSLKSIPNGIHKLSKLSSLFMCDCESIRSLPELPPYLSKLNVSGCKSLQALPSNTGKLLHLESLQFYDCPQLDQTLLVELMANFLTHCSLVLGSELLEWFTYKSENPKEAEDCIVKVELPLLKDSDKPMNKGIAFGIVVYPTSSHYPPSMICDCMVGNTTIASWYFDIPYVALSDSSSETLWLAFDKNLLGRLHWAMEGEAWYVKYAGLAVSFKFCMLEKIKIKRCGVSLLY
ncbi:Disease resistance protein TAO1, partial [Linum perenne]